jgi:phospholipid/cholesterol/gamma-HCH transport system ATP-binding protein
MIEFRDVHKKLYGAPVLRGVDMKINRGEALVILGPTGAGKSVTLRHIVGLHKPDSGNIMVDGEDVGGLSGWALERLRSRFGVLFQSGALLNWMSVRDNIALPLREKRRLPENQIDEKVEEALEMVGLSGDGEKMPAGISGGMKKRAGLARAIVTEPEIVLYDEPTSGLDPIMSRKIDKLIVSLKKKLNITSVVVTHDLISAFGIADRIVMMCDGQVVESGSVEEFKASGNGLVRDFIAAYGIDC